ncbi:hypothetical protein ACG10_02020 [Azotobacter chroococcum]|nr:hypothetical protein ACG10_02020 [Azotobacter chroococcum]
MPPSRTPAGRGRAGRTDLGRPARARGRYAGGESRAARAARLLRRRAVRRGRRSRPLAPGSAAVGPLPTAQRRRGHAPRRHRPLVVRTGHRPAGAAGQPRDAVLLPAAGGRRRATPAGCRGPADRRQP